MRYRAIRIPTYKLNIILVLFISSLLLIITNLYNNTLYTIGIIAIVSYVMFFSSWFYHYKVRINYYTIFLMFTFVFYFGQFFLMIIGIPMESGRTILDGLLPTDMLIKTGKLIINIMIILHIGVLFSTLNINKYNILKNSNTKFYDNYAFKRIALLIFIISIIPNVLLLIENIKITFTYGYGAIFQSDYYTLGGFNNILRFISLLTIPSFLMLLISYRGSKKLKIFYIFITVYIIMYFLSGSRLNGVLLLSILLLIKHYWYKPIKGRELIKLIIGMVIILTILSTISEIRNVIYISSDVKQVLGETIKDIIIKNPIFLSLEEAGYTFLATATVITYAPSVVPYQYGMSYINSIFMLFPNLFWAVHPAAATNTDIVFKGFLTSYGGIGSSFIAESYWNFGYGSILMALIFGILIGIITKKIAKFSWQQNPKMFYLAIYVAQICLFYVRSDTISFWRNFVYYGIIPLLLSSLITNKSKR